MLNSSNAFSLGKGHGSVGVGPVSFELTACRYCTSSIASCNSSILSRHHTPCESCQTRRLRHQRMTKCGVYVKHSFANGGLCTVTVVPCVWITHSKRSMCLVLFHIQNEFRNDNVNGETEFASKLGSKFLLDPAGGLLDYRRMRFGR